MPYGTRFRTLAWVNSSAIWLSVGVIGLIVSVESASAQTDASIRGDVIASADQSALPGVTLTLAALPSGERVSTTSDADGRFSFQSLRPGQYVLSSWLDSFAPSRIEFPVCVWREKTRGSDL